MGLYLCSHLLVCMRSSISGPTQGVLYSSWKSSAKTKQTSEKLRTSENRTGIPYVRTRKDITLCNICWGHKKRRRSRRDLPRPGGTRAPCAQWGLSASLPTRGRPVPHGVRQHPCPTRGRPVPRGVRQHPCPHRGRPVPRGVCQHPCPYSGCQQHPCPRRW